MITTLYKNGNVYREIYANGNKAFMSGNNDEHPFLFEFDSTWNLHRFALVEYKAQLFHSDSSCFIPRLDSLICYGFFGEEKELNVMISKRVASIEEFSKNMNCNKNKCSLAAPNESLIKKNRWFYTKYSFKAVYHKLQYDVPISIDDYLTKEEQLLWTQGNMCNYKWMNGSEMSNYLTEIGDKFLNWHGHNRFEFCLECVKRAPTSYDLNTDKEKIYKQTLDFVNSETFNITPETLCHVLDSYYKTSCFSNFYKDNSDSLNHVFERTFAVEELIPDVISYELIIQGNLLQTNAPVIQPNTLIWKVDGTRLLFDDYILTAEYRIMNRWAFWITGLLILIAVCSSVTLWLRRR
jgi:hypothetical protein